MSAIQRTTKQQRLGVVAWFKFEGVKLRLADNTFYTPDFAVMLTNGQMELHEVKGFWQDDARAKIKIAADMYPFRFLAVRPKGNRSLSGVLCPPAPTRNNPSHIRQGGAGSDQGDSDQQQVAAA